jgi:hypothetical protein
MINSSFSYVGGTDSGMVQATPSACHCSVRRRHVTDATPALATLNNATRGYHRYPVWLPLSFFSNSDTKTAKYSWRKTWASVRVTVGT